MRTVVVAKFVPWPPNSGDKRRTLGVVRALAERGPVTVCAFAGPDEDAGPLEAEGIDVVAVPRAVSPVHLAQGVLRSRSLTAARFWDPGLAERVRAAAADADVLVVEHVQMTPYARGIRPGVTVLDMHNIESSLTGRYAASQRGPRSAVLHAEARALRALERRATAAADVVAVVSEVDAELLADVVRHPRVVVLPNAWGEPDPLPPATDPVVSFVALMSWAPNVDAATWFAEHVWPRVVAELPAARLLLVGRNPTEQVRALAGPTVEVTGTVDDLAPWYLRTRVAVAPLRAGGGSRLKILEALAAGRPLVATTVGAEGLEDLIGRGVTVADEPAEMADALLALLRDPQRATDEGLQGAEAVGSDHSWRAATGPFLTAVDAVRASRGTTR